MRSFVLRSLGIVSVFVCLFSRIQPSAAQPAPGPNSDPTYQQLRNITLSGAIGVSNLTRKRDAGTFHLRSGTVCFLAPVQGKVTGAAFVGDGTLVLDPPLNAERHTLRLQMIEKNPQKFHAFWKDEHDLLLEKDPQGFRGIDAGPLTMGYRLNNTRTGGGVTRRLIYPKGAYVLHMLREMMSDRRTGDQNFKDMMQDFVKTYSGSTASTEDFKAMVEKHMTEDMKSIGDGNMNWFFDEYVYGTALPAYALDYSFENNADGDVVLNFKITQSNVDDRFRMLVPIYLELADGRTVNLGRARMIGNKTVEEKVPIKGLKDKPRRALLNYMDDVLASN